MYERLLIPLDGSDAAEIVLPYAEEVAAKLGADVSVVHICDSDAAYTIHSVRPYLERVTIQIQSQIQEYRPEVETKVHDEVFVGKPSEKILHYADTANVSLIVMASRGSSGRGPWLLGSVAAKVLRATSKPVLLIRAAASDSAIQERRLIKKILLPLDGSAVGESALPFTAILSTALGAEVVLLHVLKEIPSWTGAESMPYAISRDDEENRKALAMDYLNNVEKQFKGTGVSTSSCVEPGSPADQIIEYAMAHAVDLIAMSSHGRSGIRRWVFGSITDKVLHAGDTAVLVVRAVKK